jgi:hypothetical protein
VGPATAILKSDYRCKSIVSGDVEKENTNRKTNKQSG